MELMSYSADVLAYRRARLTDSECNRFAKRFDVSITQFKKSLSVKCVLSKIQKKIPLYGVEFEVGILNSYNIGHALDAADVISDFGIVKRDGSLINGFEIVSVPMSLKKHNDGIWDELFNSKCFSYNGDKHNAGIHIHVGKEAFNENLCWLKMQYFFGKEENQDFLNKVMGRKGNSFCKRTILTDKESHFGQKSINFGVMFTDKYVVMNMNNRRATVEFRGFNSLFNKEKFLANIEFIDALLSWTKNISLNNAFEFENFVEYVKKEGADYKNLKGWLIKCEYIPEKKKRTS